jgi:acyl-CoA reductase-like NAD-dependent aldehyde dehydrogenase
MNGHLMPESPRTQAFSDGDFVDAADSATFESLAPANVKVIAQIAACGDSDVERAVTAARRAFESRPVGFASA